MRQVVLLSGGSSGIGLHTAELLQDSGYVVYEISRHENSSVKGVHHIRCDVTDAEGIRVSVESVIAQEGRIDILINNAGFGISGAVEFTEISAAKKQFDVNFYGMVNLTRAVLPHMRSRRQGRIISISSVAAVIPIPFQTFYSASKAAVNAYTLALANEVRPFGISVCAIMPGDIHTGFTAAREKQLLGNGEYGGRIEHSVARMEKDEQSGMDPYRIAKKVLSIAKKRRIKPFYTVRFDYQFFVQLSKLLPASLFNLLVYRIYG